MASSRDRRASACADIDETTPLIRVDPQPIADGSFAVVEPVVDTQDGAPKDKPLPKFQLFLLCYARVMEPIAFFSIFPFVAQMVKQNGNLPASDVGFYSGLIESIFSAAQMVVLIFWGRLADRVGRKPILILSLIGSVIGPAIFGLSQTVWQMVAFRCFAGVFSGSTLIIRTMIADISTAKTQATAYGWFAFSGNVGIFLGPLIGGVLADPVTQYPSLFKGLDLFEKYPYALPGFSVAILSATGAVACVFFLEETLKDSDDDVASGQDASPASPPRAKPLTLMELMKSPGVGVAILVYCYVMLFAFCFTALMPVFLFTPVNLGGLGLTTSQISVYFAAQGASQATWLVLVFPPLQHRVGSRGLLRLCAMGYPIFFVGYIVMNLLLRDGSQTARIWFWIEGSIVCFVGPGVSMAFSAVQLTLNDASPSPHVLGTLNAIAMTCSSAIRSLAPGLMTALYAIGVRNQILGGHLAWVALLPLTFLLSLAAKWLPDDKLEKRDDDAS